MRTTVTTIHGPQRPSSAPLVPSRYILAAPPQPLTPSQLHLPLSQPPAARRAFRPVSAPKRGAQHFYSVPSSRPLSAGASRPAWAGTSTSTADLLAAASRPPPSPPAAAPPPAEVQSLRLLAADARQRLSTILGDSRLPIATSTYPSEDQRTRRAHTLRRLAVEEYEKELSSALHAVVTDSPRKPSPPRQPYTQEQRAGAAAGGGGLLTFFEEVGPDGELVAARHRGGGGGGDGPKAPGSALRSELANWQLTLASTGAIVHAAQAAQVARSGGEDLSQVEPPPLLHEGAMAAAGLGALHSKLRSEAGWVLTQSRRAVTAARMRRELGERLSRHLPERAAVAAALAVLEEAPIERMLAAYAEELVADKQGMDVAAAAAAVASRGGAPEAMASPAVPSHRPAPTLLHEEAAAAEEEEGESRPPDWRDSLRK